MFSYMKCPSVFYKQTFSLAAPIVLQNLVTSMLGMADIFMVGMLGELPMAAVTLANIPLFVVQMFIFGTQSGASVLLSQYWGKRDERAMNRVIGVAMGAAGLVSLLVALILLMWPNQFLGLFCDSSNLALIEKAGEYGRFAGLSYVCAAITMIYVTAYRCMERPQLGMYILITSMLINIFLNWVLIFGKLGAPELGIKGAAIATLIARIIEVIIVLIHMRAAKGFRIELGVLLRPGREMAQRFLRYGGPVIANETMWGLGSSVFPTIMAYMQGSTEILAGYTIVGNIEKIVMVMGFGLAATASVIIGREVGAGRVEQVRDIGKRLMTLAFLFGAMMGALLFIFTKWIAPSMIYPLFHLSAGASAVAGMMLLVQSFIRPLRDFNCVAIVGVLRGGGDVKMATWIDVLPLWLAAIPVAAVLGLVVKADILWVYLATTLESFIKCFFALLRFRSGKWIRDLTVPMLKEN